MGFSCLYTSPIAYPARLLLIQSCYLSLRPINLQLPYHPPISTLSEASWRTDPHVTWSPTLAAGLLLINTVELPPIVVPAWHVLQQWLAKLSPRRWAPRLFISTVSDALFVGRGGKQPCPEQLSPRRTALGTPTPYCLKRYLRPQSHALVKTPLGAGLGMLLRTLNVWFHSW